MFRPSVVGIVDAFEFKDEVEWNRRVKFSFSTVKRGASPIANGTFQSDP